MQYIFRCASLVTEWARKGVAKSHYCEKHFPMISHSRVQKRLRGHSSSCGLTGPLRSSSNVHSYLFLRFQVIRQLFRRRQGRGTSSLITTLRRGHHISPLQRSAPSWPGEESSEQRRGGKGLFAEKEGPIRSGYGMRAGTVGLHGRGTSVPTESRSPL